MGNRSYNQRRLNMQVATLPKTALLSAYSKTPKLLGFAKFLKGLDWELLGSKGTAEFLNKNGVFCMDIGTLVGEPILGHRVVTLSRKVYAALLSRVDSSNDMLELKELGVSPIGLVYVTLYPLAEELKRKGRTFESVIDKTDIGGPTMLRAAAKGGRMVITSDKQLRTVREHIRAGTAGNQRFLSYLACEAERMVGDYAYLSAGFHERTAHGGKA